MTVMEQAEQGSSEEASQIMPWAIPLVGLFLTIGLSFGIGILFNGSSPSAGGGSVIAQPPLIAAVVALLGVLATMLVNNLVSFNLARRRNSFEEALADKKFELDSRLAAQKMDHDRSLEDWRRKSAVAEEALADFYDCQSRIAAIRSPASYMSENDDRQGRNDEDEETRARRDVYYPIQRRLLEHRNTFNEIYARRFKAIALFGRDAEQPYMELWGVLARIQTAVAMLMRPYPHADAPHAREALIRMESVIWEGLEEPDELQAILDTAINRAEGIFGLVILNRPAEKGGPNRPVS